MTHIWFLNGQNRLGSPIHALILTRISHLVSCPRPARVFFVIFFLLHRFASRFFVSVAFSFRKWFADYDAEVWDKQFEQDVATGRLEKLAEEALRDVREGLCADL
jgi:hypothetical protein